jgi:hypothetical protein
VPDLLLTDNERTVGRFGGDGAIAKAELAPTDTNLRTPTRAGRSWWMARQHALKELA